MIIESFPSIATFGFDIVTNLATTSPPSGIVPRRIAARGSATPPSDDLAPAPCWTYLPITARCLSHGHRQAHHRPHAVHHRSSLCERVVRSLPAAPGLEIAT